MNIPANKFSSSFISQRLELRKALQNEGVLWSHVCSAKIVAEEAGKLREW